MRKEIKVRISEHTQETFYFYDKYDLRELPTPKSVEKIRPDCEDQNSNLDFFKLYDEDGDLIAKVAVDINEFYDIDLEDYGSNFEALLSEYDFFTKNFVATSSLNFVKSDYDGWLKEDAIEDAEEKITESFGITEFDHDFILRFFDDLPSRTEAWADEDGTHYYIAYLLYLFQQNNRTEFNIDKFADFAFSKDRSLSDEDLYRIKTDVKTLGLEDTIKKYYRTEF